MSKESSSDVATPKESPKKWEAALIRASGGTQQAAADKAGVAKKTIQRWERNNDEYWAIYNRHRRQLKNTTWGEVWLALRNALRADNVQDRTRAAQILLTSIDREEPTRIDIEADVNLTGGVAIYVPEREDDG
jgi:transcriptional regulator with XRE-family HTH domain